MKQEIIYHLQCYKNLLTHIDLSTASSADQIARTETVLQIAGIIDKLNSTKKELQ